jgi:hypothetical protein
MRRTYSCYAQHSLSSCSARESSTLIASDVSVGESGQLSVATDSHYYDFTPVYLHGALRAQPPAQDKKTFEPTMQNWLDGDP